MMTNALVWQQIYWPQPLAPEATSALLRQLAADQRSPTLVFEARATNGGVTYWLGAPPDYAPSLRRLIPRLVPGATVVPHEMDRPAVLSAGTVRVSTRHRPLRADAIESVSRAALSALTDVRSGEWLVLQLVIGPRRIPLSVSTNTSAALTQPWWNTAWHGDSARIDGEKRTALRQKLAEHGAACTLRVGVTAASPGRRRALALGLLAALRTSESAGVQLRIRRDNTKRLNAVRAPWRWPLRLNVSEMAALLAWPIGKEGLPGLPAAHPRLVPPVANAATSGRVVARANAPGSTALLRLSARDATQHMHVIGPTGVGKSTLLLNLITQDIADGRGVIVVDPKGDLVEDVLARVPASRTGDVVVLDPADVGSPVGINPLANRSAAEADLAADGVLSVFRGLYADSWGPRTQDILHASLLTLSRRRDTSLVMLPLLLTNPGFRRSLTASIDDPIALGPFWAWYENLTEGERQQAIAPVMNKLRPFLLRPSMRAVLGQVRPRFDVLQVFTERKILLVSLAKGRLGSEAARLLGSLAVARVWQTTLERVHVAPERRHPVLLYIDEVQDYLHLPTDLADVLAQARGLGVGLIAAHQHLAQLPPAMRSAMLANARSKVCFTLGPEDAAVMARGSADLAPEDFTMLGGYQVNASLVSAGHTTPFASGITLPAGPVTSNAAKLRRASRDRFGQPLNEIEDGLAKLLGPSRTAGGDDFGRRPRRQS